MTASLPWGGSPGFRAWIRRQTDRGRRMTVKSLRRALVALATVCLLAAAHPTA
ncbi:hypothetical protein GL263_18960, partial [Streptomyces durbertensis]|nr:hypothetical protein [Streptomyces durbertensis]